ncbi:hypothetical protein M752DRAFT_263230 [Aspergillus phoenicis ATCC 13157]|uniref:Aminoglycoside phosphotransferase domain-containing protein n=1 Tax=Aspergillus phoenicis ATCC 13157 TaxID=1353007 RepID=A0A370PTU1_ASPPH|nr:hypothetical protein M752DRAFT_263230 [Aspergillus phoenicis ATCC 13157]
MKDFNSRDVILHFDASALPMCRNEQIARWALEQVLSSADGGWGNGAGVSCSRSKPEIVRIWNAHSNPKHATLLKQILIVFAHIIPSDDTRSPIMLHHDLHADNIFIRMDMILLSSQA